MDRDTLHLLVGLAHELRTPISAIAGYSSLLSMGAHGPVSDAQAESLRRIQHNQQQLLTLISDVVQYAEAASGAVEIAVESTSLGALVTQALDAMRADADARGVRFHVESSLFDASHAAGRSMSDEVTVDPAVTRTVLDAMLEDALAHSARDMEVHVGITAAGPLLQVEVRCAGAPITIERAASMFAPYSRDEAGRPVHASGRSLLLARARALAEAMGAELRVCPDSSHRVLQLGLPRAANLRSGVG